MNCQMTWNVKWQFLLTIFDDKFWDNTWYMLHVTWWQYILLNISNLYADPDARSMNLSRITRRNTRSVLSSPGRSLFYVLCSTFYVLGWKNIGVSMFQRCIENCRSGEKIIVNFSIFWYKPMFGTNQCLPPISHPWEDLAPENSLLCT